MATTEELLRKLDERFILGEITDEQYQQLRSRLQSQSAAGTLTPRDASPDASAPVAVNMDLPPQGTGAAGGVGEAAGGTPATAGGMNIADSVIKGNVTSGSASVGSININLGQAGAGAAGASAAELEYEKYVLLALHAGGVLENIRRELDERRHALGLSIRLAREIEEACLASCGRGPAGRGNSSAPRPPGADPVSRFFKSASASISSMFATQQSVQPTGPVRGTSPLPPATITAAGKPPPPPPVLSTPVAGGSGVGTPPPLPWAARPSGEAKAGEPEPLPDPESLRAEIKSGIKAELEKSLDEPVAKPAPGTAGPHTTVARPPERKPPPLPLAPAPPPLPWGSKGNRGAGPPRP